MTDELIDQAEPVNGKDSVAAAEAFQKGWTQGDIQWLQQLEGPLQPIALRHGRKVFALSMSVGFLTAGFARMESFTRGNNRCTSTLAQMADICNNLTAMAQEGYGVTELQIAECKADVERMMALATAVKQKGEAMSKGGIILSH